MKGSSVVRIAALVSLALPLSVQAWEPINPSRPVWDGATAPYQINEVGSVDLGMATTITEVRRGMDDWTTPACSGLSTSYGGTTSRQPGTYEGESVIGWVESGWTNSSSAIGVTGTRYTSGSIIEADMEMNGVHFQWTTSPGSGSNVNVYSIALHEGGHYMGLGHSSSSSAAMYFAYSGGVSTMTADDETGICTLYPGGGGGTTDCTTTGCPTGQSCVSGACVDDTPPGGGGDVCSPCTGHAACGGGGDYCLTYPDGGGYCGSACTSDSDCGSDRCLTLSTGARQCVRFDGSEPSCTGGGTPPPTGTCSVDAECSTGQRCESGSCVAAGSGSTPLGGTCADHAECESGSCLAGVCTQSCEWPSGTCPSGFYCDGEATGACGAGVCLAGTAGGGADGDHCSQDSDCANLYCFLGLCSQPCNPETVGSCPGGGVCQVGPLACRGACGTSGSLGDPCDGNDACASGLCAETDDGSFCTNLCDDSSPCPTGFRCSTAGAVRVCEPDGGSLGGACEANEDCATGICAFEESRNYCTRLCDPASPCPSSMACVDSGTAGIQVCQPTEDGSLPSSGRRMASGCAISSGPLSGSGAWLLGLLGIAWARRRFAHLSPRR
ncbi:MAG TPA: matrixin family metalloprotease [Polyangiaceae bacterium]|nr:matrixin family metalloprotease [Polyangiaceae bacterium]